MPCRLPGWVSVRATSPCTTVTTPTVRAGGAEAADAVTSAGAWAQPASTGRSAARAPARRLRQPRKADVRNVCVEHTDFKEGSFETSSCLSDNAPLSLLHRGFRPRG